MTRSKMWVPPTSLHKDTFQNVGTIYQTTQRHVPKCGYHLPNYTTALSKMSVPSTKLQKDTSKNVGTIYQTAKEHFPKCQHHLTNYKRTLSKMSVPSIILLSAMSQNTGTIYETTLLYTKINVPSNKLHSFPKYLYHLPYYSIMS